MRDQEMILRFLALLFGGDYTEYMAEFLNKYMGRNRDLSVNSAEDITSSFTGSVDVVHEALGTSAFRPRGPFNAAVFDAVTVGLARRLSRGVITDRDAVRSAYEELLSNDDFISATETGTAHLESVTSRLDLGTSAFADVP